MVIEKNKDYVGSLIRATVYKKTFLFLIVHQEHDVQVHYSNPINLKNELALKALDIRNFNTKSDLWFEYNKDYSAWEVLSDGQPNSLVDDSRA